MTFVQELLDYFNDDFENNPCIHTAEKLYEILNKIMSKFVSITTVALSYVHGNCNHATSCSKNSIQEHLPIRLSIINWIWNLAG